VRSWARLLQKRLRKLGVANRSIVSAVLESRRGRRLRTGESALQKIQSLPFMADKTNKVVTMDQATVTAVSPGAVLSPVSVPSVSPSERTFNSAVSGAVKTLNESGVVGDGREVTFSLDRATRLPVVKVVDTSTQEVISQWPPEYALRLAEISKSGGLIQDESIF
jgi:uncharacterized FlaG/YvyC family protein